MGDEHVRRHATLAASDHCLTSSALHCKFTRTMGQCLLADSRTSSRTISLLEGTDRTLQRVLRYAPRLQLSSFTFIGFLSALALHLTLFCRTRDVQSIHIMRRSHLWMLNNSHASFSCVPATSPRVGERKRAQCALRVSTWGPPSTP